MNDDAVRIARELEAAPVPYPDYIMTLARAVLSQHTRIRELEAWLESIVAELKERRAADRGEQPRIVDPATSWDVEADGQIVRLVLHFQDGEDSNLLARVHVDMSATEAMKLASRLFDGTAVARKSSRCRFCGIPVGFDHDTCGPCSDVP